MSLHPSNVSTPYAPCPQKLAKYPIVLQGLAAKHCLVIGGGKVAERKVNALLEAGANPIVISPELSAALVALKAKGAITHKARVYQEGDVAGAFLVIVATNSPKVNEAVVQEAHKLGILFNHAGCAPKGNFATVASLKRSEVMITVSSPNPSLSRALKRYLEHLLPEHTSPILAQLSQEREKQKSQTPQEIYEELTRLLACS